MNTVLLKGVVGSRAYGLAGPESDYDYLGVFAVPTVELFKSAAPAESAVTKDPDCTLHEVRKFCQLATRCNPSVLELLWLDSYLIRHPLGDRLIKMRDSFLSRKAVRGAYLGYASEQLRRIRQPRNPALVNRTRAVQGLPPETEEDLTRKVAKHGRHVARLLFQAASLELGGRLQVHMEPWEATYARRLGEEAAAGDAKDLEAMVDGCASLFERDASKSALPDKPDHQAVDAVLVQIRMELLPGA